jgi:hypothetical protein
MALGMAAFVPIYKDERLLFLSMGGQDAAQGALSL